MPKTKVCTICGKKKVRNEFYKRKSTRDGRRADCKTCMLMRQTQYYKSKREKWLNFMQIDKLHCSACGFKEWPALDFHHNNSKEKEFQISNFIYKAFNEKNKQRLLRELGKCIILCANCHRIFHYNQRQRKLKEDQL